MKYEIHNFGPTNFAGKKVDIYIQKQGTSERIYLSILKTALPFLQDIVNQANGESK